MGNSGKEKNLWKNHVGKNEKGKTFIIFGEKQKKIIGCQRKRNLFPLAFLK